MPVRYQLLRQVRKVVLFGQATFSRPSPHGHQPYYLYDQSDKSKLGPNTCNINHLPLLITPAPHRTEHVRTCSHLVLWLHVVGTIVNILYQMRTLKHKVISNAFKITKLRRGGVVETAHERVVWT